MTKKCIKCLNLFEETSKSQKYCNICKPRKIFCLCGCGLMCRNMFVKGHWTKGKPLSEKHKKNIGNSNFGKKHSQETILKIKEKMKDFKHSKETKEKMSVVALEKGFGKWMTGKKMKPESIEKGKIKRTGIKKTELCKKKISDANRGEKNGMFGKKHSIEIKKQISENSKLNWKKDYFYEKQLKYRNSIVGKINCRKGAIKTSEKIKHLWYHNTKPELQMKKILEDLNINFIHSYAINDIFHQYVADFYVPEKNLIIEVDGKYWHEYPFGTKNDLMRKTELKDAGYKLLRFWENEFDINSVKEKIND